MAYAILYCERVDSVENTAMVCDQAFIAGSFARRLCEQDLVHVDFCQRDALPDLDRYPGSRR